MTLLFINRVFARIVACALLFAIPVQGASAAANALHGPSHHHGAPAPPGAGAHYNHAHTHVHSDARLHYRLPGHVAAAVPAADPHDAVAAAPRMSAEQMSAAAFIALTGSASALQSPLLRYGVSTLRAASLPSAPVRRIEKPPRILTPLPPAAPRRIAVS